MERRGEGDYIRTSVGGIPGYGYVDVLTSSLGLRWQGGV